MGNSNPPKAAPIQDTGDLDITQIIQTYLEGLHNPRDDSLYNELRAKRDTEALKAAIQHSYIRKSDVLAKALELIGENGLIDANDPAGPSGASWKYNGRAELRAELRQAFIKQWGKKE